jgi:DNA-binding MltR family transcriptional regulator
MGPKNPLPVAALGVEVQKIGDALVSGSDLAVALIASSFLDECLRSLLMAFFRKGDTSESLLRSGRGVIGSFAARFELAYSLSLIEKSELKNLRTIGEIRNAFAHSYADGAFDDDHIRPLCESLDYAYEVFVTRGGSDRDPKQVRADLDSLYRNVRARFTHACVTLGQTLIFKAREVQRRDHRGGA